MEKYSRERTSDMIRKMSTDQLLDLWEMTENSNDAGIPTVRGWLMAELEGRNPDGFDAWLSQEAPEDKDLRQYITTAH